MNRSGFTLPETVVAMALFAAAAVALSQAAVNAHNGLFRLERKGAPHLRHDWIRSQVLTITDRSVLEEGGELEYPRHERKNAPQDEELEPEQPEVSVRWEAEVFPTPLLDVHKVVVTLRFERGDAMLPEQQMGYYIYRPGWYEDAGGRDDLVVDKQDAWEREQMERGF